MVSTTVQAPSTTPTPIVLAPRRPGPVMRALGTIGAALLWLPKTIVLGYGEYLLLHYNWGGPVCTSRRK